MGIHLSCLGHLENLLLFLTLEVLVDSMLHRVNSLFETTVPVILDCVVSPAHEFLRDETPFLGALVS